MFAADDDDPYALEIIKRLLAQGIPEAEIGQHVEAALPGDGNGDASSY